MARYFLFLLIVLSMLVPSSALADSYTTCVPLAVPVSTNPQAVLDGTIQTTLCVPLNANRRVLQVLVPGATYNHIYWDFPGSSYVRAMASKGYSTLNIDRLGTGQSTKPVSTSVTLANDAYTLHQVVAFARHLGYQKVVVTGHSLGSVVAVVEQTTYQDTDGLILSGFSLGVQPAVLQSPPPFAAASPAGYLTTIPGTRGPLFYNSADALQSTIDLDEATKDVLSGTEFNDLFAFMLNPGEAALVQSVTVPILDTIGQYDSIFVPANTVGQSFVLPNSGHDVNLALNAQAWFDVAGTWLGQR